MVNAKDLHNLSEGDRDNLCHTSLIHSVMNESIPGPCMHKNIVKEIESILSAHGLYRTAHLYSELENAK